MIERRYTYVPFILFQIIIAGMGLPWLGFLFGFIVAKLCRQPQADVRAISIETGIQNTGVAIFLLRFTLKPPADDLTTGKCILNVYLYCTTVIVSLLNSFSSDSCVFRNYDTNTIDNFVCHKVNLSVQAKAEGKTDIKFYLIIKQRSNYRYFQYHTTRCVYITQLDKVK